MQIVGYWEDAEKFEEGPFVACAHPMCAGLYRVEQALPLGPGSGMPRVPQTWKLGWLTKQEIEPILDALNRGMEPAREPEERGEPHE